MELDQSSRRRNRARPPLAPAQLGDPFAPRALSTGDPFASRAAPGGADPFATPRPAFTQPPAQSAFPASAPTFGTLHSFGTQQSFGTQPFGVPQSFGAQQPFTPQGNAPFPTVPSESFGGSSPAPFGAPSFKQQSFGGNDMFKRAPFGQSSSVFSPGQPFTRTASDRLAQNDPFQSQLATNPTKPDLLSAPPYSGHGYAPGSSALPAEDPFVRKHTRTEQAAVDRPRTLSSQLMLKAVPLPLFSREALSAHFEQFGVTPISISLRGSHDPDARRTAVVSFSTPQQTSGAMSRARYYQGASLPMSYYRPAEKKAAVQQADAHVQQGHGQPHGMNAPPQQQPVQESTELLFSFVPEDLFSEEAVRHLFNSISGNEVVAVSVRSRRFRGSVKRTAIVTFSGIAGARAALKNLPLYNGQKLQVAFRSRPPHLRSHPAPFSQFSNDAMSIGESNDTADVSGGAIRNSGLAGPAMALGEHGEHVGLPSLAGHSTGVGVSRHADSVQVNEETVKLDWDHGADEVAAARAKIEAKMARLRATIEEKERAKKEQNARAKTERKVKQRSRETSNASAPDRGKDDEQRKRIAARQVVRPESNNDNDDSWRKVGEKVSILNATEFVGTCQTMCPAKEFSERILQRDISVFETVDALGVEPDPSRAVKKYRRSAAVSEQPSPEDIRPPLVLLKTMGYLLGICDSETEEFVDIHNFVRDRTRSLRQDFTFQGVHDEACIKIHEQSVRFHIMSEHRLFGTDAERFSSKQNREQLDKCLISLREMYDLRREEKLDTSPNEPEMQAYYMLMQMSKPKTCVQLCTGLAPEVRRSLPVQFALQVIRVASESFGNYFGYFALVRAAPYLMACLMHSWFVKMRVQALQVINSTHGNPGSPDHLEIPKVTCLLGFEDDDETIAFCECLGLEVLEEQNGGDSDALTFVLSTPSSKFDPEKSSEWVAARSDMLIESKSDLLKPSELIAGVESDDFDMDKLPHCSSSHLQRSPRENSTRTTTGDLLQPQPARSRTVRNSISKESNAQVEQGNRLSVFERLGGTSTLQPPTQTSPDDALRSQGSPQPTSLFVRQGIRQPDALAETMLAPPAPASKLPAIVDGFSAVAADKFQNASQEVLKPATSAKTLQAKTPSLPSTAVFDAPINQTQHVESLRAAPPATGLGSQLPIGIPLTSSKQAPTEKRSISDVPRFPSSSVVQKPLSQFRELSQPFAFHELEEPSGKLHLHDRRRSTAALPTNPTFLDFGPRKNSGIRATPLPKGPSKAEIEREEQRLASEREEVERARNHQLAQSTFAELVEKIAKDLQHLKKHLTLVDQHFQSMDIEDGGASKVLGECEKADSDFIKAAAELKLFKVQLDAAKPVSDLGREAKKKLSHDIDCVRKYGKEVWGRIWEVKGLAIAAPQALEKKTVSASEKTGCKLTVDLAPRVRVKRKASADGGMREAGERAKKHTAGGFVMPSTISRKGGELAALSKAMKRCAVIRWQAAISEGLGVQTSTEKLLHTWAKERFADGDCALGVVRRMIDEEPPIPFYISVREAGIGRPIPSTSNLVVFSIDTSSAGQVTQRLREIQTMLVAREVGGRSIGSLPPSLIFLYCRTPLGMGNIQNHRSNVERLSDGIRSLHHRSLLSHFHLIEVSLTVARYQEENKLFTKAVSDSALQLEQNAREHSCDLHPTSLGEYVVQTANSAWIKYISSAKGSVNEMRSHRDVIDCVNRAWSALAKRIGEEERRWAEEMHEERNKLREAKRIILRKMRLPLPTEIQATTASEYIAHLARVGGIVCPTVGYRSAPPVALFCRSLGHVILPFVSSTLQSFYFKVLYLPRSSLSSESSPAFYSLSRSLSMSNGMEIRPSLNVERAWDGTPVAERRVLQSQNAAATEQKLKANWSAHVDEFRGDAALQARPRRRSMEFLPRTLDFSPASGTRRKCTRRKSLPVSRQKAREMFAFYDEMCKTEETHAALLRDTENVLHRKATSPGGLT